MYHIFWYWLQFLVFSQLIIGFGLWLYSRKYAHLPGEFGMPIFGNLYHVLNSLVFGTQKALNERIAKTLDKHGKVACLWVGPFIWIVVAEPSLIEELSSLPAAVNKESMVYDKLNVLSIGAFTTSQSGAEWRHYRKDVNVSLQKHRLKSYHEVFVKRGIELAKVFGEQKGEFDAHPLITLNSLDITLETQFGLDFNELANKNFELVKDIMRLSHAMGQTLGNPIYNVLSGVILRYIESRTIHLKKIAKLLEEELIKNYEFFKNIEDEELPVAAIRLKYNLENNISMEKTLLELKEFVFVISHSLSDTLSGLLILLALNPKVQDKVWEEQKEIFSDSSRDPSYEDISKMRYLERVIKEGCRFLAGPILARHFTEQAKLGDYKIPTNSTVLMGSFRMRMDPEYWDNPTEFDPDHFLPEKVLKRHKFANIAFGVIPRHCPGVSYTVNICKVILSTILRKFKLSSTIKPEELKFYPEILMVLDRPYSISCEKRIQI